MISKLKKILKILFLPLVMVFSISCGSSSNNKESKELNIYTWIQFIPSEVVEKFEKETGIKVNLSYYDNNDTLIAKLFTGANQYDIVSPSTDYVDILIKRIF